MRPSGWLIPVILSLPLHAAGGELAGFEDFASRYRAAPSEARDRIATAFVEWQKAHGGPPAGGADKEAAG